MGYWIRSAGWPSKGQACVTVMTSTARVTLVTICFPATLRNTTVKILFVNNDGGGFADYIELPHGTNVQELFDQKMHGAKAHNYLIRDNRQPAARDQVLVEGDRVSMTPTKIEGALRALRLAFRLAS